MYGIYLSSPVKLSCVSTFSDLIPEGAIVRCIDLLHAELQSHPLMALLCNVNISTKPLDVKERTPLLFTKVLLSKGDVCLHCTGREQPLDRHLNLSRRRLNQNYNPLPWVLSKAVDMTTKIPRFAKHKMHTKLRKTR
jgi:hypothetical protein